VKNIDVKDKTIEEKDKQIEFLKQQLLAQQNAST
jgi:hypothetical protein